MTLEAAPEPAADVAVGVGVFVGTAVGVGVGVFVGAAVGVFVGVGFGVLRGVGVCVTPPAGVLVGIAVLVAVDVAVAQTSSTADVLAYDLIVKISEPVAEIISSKSASAPIVTRTGVKRARSLRVPRRCQEVGSGWSLWPESTGFFLIQKNSSTGPSAPTPCIPPEPHSRLHLSKYKPMHA